MYHHSTRGHARHPEYYRGRADGIREWANSVANQKNKKALLNCARDLDRLARMQSQNLRLETKIALWGNEDHD